MDVQTFEHVRAEFNLKEAALLTFKRGEYADNVNVLKNFYMQADFNGLTPETVAMMLAFKHIQGIQNILETRPVGKRGWFWEEGTKEGLKQRIADARNYLLLLAAVLEAQERIGGNGTVYPVFGPGEIKGGLLPSPNVGPTYGTGTEDRNGRDG